MCGLAGFLADYGQVEDLTHKAQLMAEAIRHRGPDDQGVWVEPAVGLGFAHRRLAILDLSPEGRQPMLSANGRWALIYNGEVYNFWALRTELTKLGYDHWHSRTDTEVVLTAFAHWGVEMALHKFIGMFAGALWDHQLCTLTLFRDRMGEKPLYYGWIGKVLLFGSELRAIKAHPLFTKDIDRNAMALMLRYGYIPAPYSIYQGIYKLPPGTFLTINVSKPSCGGGVGSPHILKIEPQPYWTVQHAVTQGLRQPFQGDVAKAISELEHMLRESVRGQLMADVPVGALLSGGIDSSLVVAIMQAQSNQRVRTFSIGFTETTYNEAHYAKAVAAHLGTDHTELYVSATDALALVPNLSTIYDEPFADASQIPTILVATLARQQVTVSLSGDGGDEVFCGYNRYLWTMALWRRLQWMPTTWRQKISTIVTAVTPQYWDVLGKFASVLLPQLQLANFGDKVHKLAGIIDVEKPMQLYQRLVTFWPDTAQLVMNSCPPNTIVENDNTLPDLADLAQHMMYLDLLTYLPDDILVKVDRAAMSVGLETRIPLLDHRLVEFAWCLPMAMKLRAGQGKWLLRQVLYRYVPVNLIERPKMGFGIPLAAWLRGPLREWAAAMLDSNRLRQEGRLNAKLIETKWQQHLRGQRNWSYQLWNVLMLQAWLTHNHM